MEVSIAMMQEALWKKRSTSKDERSTLDGSSTLGHTQMIFEGCRLQSIPLQIGLVSMKDEEGNEGERARNRGKREGKERIKREKREKEREWGLRATNKERKESHEDKSVGENRFGGKTSTYWPNFKNPPL